MAHQTPVQHVIVDAVATTTSELINIEGARKVTFVFTRTNHSAGKTVFTVTASVDGVTFVAYSKLISSASNSVSETLGRFANYDTGTANASAIYSMDLQYDCFKEIKVTATQTTDGTHNAYVLVEYDD